MGLSIGQIAGPLASMRSAPEFGQVRLGERESPLRAASSGRSERGVEAFLSRQEETRPRAGFGTGTLSGPGAALRTIRSTVEQARERTPTIQDIRERFLMQSAERRANVQRTVFNQRVGDSTRRIDLQIPEPSAQVRNFIADVNDSRGSIFTPRSAEDDPGNDISLGANRDEPGRTVSLGIDDGEGVETFFGPDEPEALGGVDTRPGETESERNVQPARIDTEPVREEPEPVSLTRAPGGGAGPVVTRDAEVPAPDIAEAGTRLDIRV